VSEPFELKDETRGKRSLMFAPPSKAMLCRQALWMKCRQANPNPVVLADFYKYEEEFSPSIVYRAARKLVRNGLLERSDVSYGYIARGQERTSYRIGVKFVEPFTSVSRKWQN
jgi:hypothetical protein